MVRHYNIYNIIFTNFFYIYNILCAHTNNNIKQSSTIVMYQLRNNTEEYLIYGKNRILTLFETFVFRPNKSNYEHS